MLKLFYIIFLFVFLFILSFLRFYNKNVNKKTIKEAMLPYESFIKRENIMFVNFLVDKKHELIEKNEKK